MSEGRGEGGGVAWAASKRRQCPSPPGVVRSPECSGFCSGPKVAAVFAGEDENRSHRFAKSFPIMSSLPNMTPINQPEEF
jgi:hypothetical protein